MTTAPTASSAPDEARTRNHTQAETLRKVADFLDANPAVRPLRDGPLWVFARDEASARAWHAFLDFPPIKVDDSGSFKARCEVTLDGGMRLILAIHDDIALTEPTPAPAPQLVEWLR